MSRNKWIDDQIKLFNLVYKPLPLEETCHVYEKNQTQILQEVKSVNFACFPQILDLRKSFSLKEFFF